MSHEKSTEQTSVLRAKNDIIKDIDPKQASKRTLSEADWAWWHGLDNMWKKVFTAHIYDKEQNDFLRVDKINKYGTTELLNPQDLLKIVGLTKLYCCLGGKLDRQESLDISPLAHLTNLTGLSLDDNQISDISPLAHLKKLKSLWLFDNQISDISPLAHLTNLTTLWLNQNQISDISPLAHLTKLRHTSVDGNLLSKKQINWLWRQLPKCEIFSWAIKRVFVKGKFLEKQWDVLVRRIQWLFADNQYPS